VRPPDAPLDVLVVEDDPDFAAHLSAMLRGGNEASWNLRCVSRVEEALLALGTATPDVVLLDLNRPDARDLQSLDRLRTLSRVPIVVMTGGDDDTLPVEVLRRGAQECLFKDEMTATRVQRTVRCAVFRSADELERTEREAALRRVTEDEALAREHLLLQSQKTEAVGRLAGGVAHDFNNLVTVMRGYAELALRRVGPGEAIRRNLDQIIVAADRAGALTHQLLAFSRNQVLQPRVLDLGGVVDGLDPMLRRIIGEDVEMIVRKSGMPGAVRADPAQMEQVIVNLVVNARDAMPDGGLLTFDLANQDLDALYAGSHPGTAPGTYVMLAVSDTGQGMSAETQARVFEPFFTTKAPGRGTGLGLSTVYGIVKQSGGFIWLYSEIGRGTVFKIYLPRVDEPVDAVPAPAAPSAVRGSETILLVEDEAALRALLTEVLESYGYRVLVAATGGAALAQAGAHGGPIDLLVTDMVMPQISGRELHARLSRDQPGLRVLFMSGYAGGAAPSAASPDGAPFLGKPFTSDALGRAVRDVLDTPPSSPPHGVRSY
jgi:two-component system, cell cycle sensor histidine kinase and response regulator CckA